MAAAGATARAVQPGSWGTVVALCGRYFAGRIDLLTRERTKTLVPITDSPFVLATGAGHARPTAPATAEDDHDLGAQLSASGADHLVVDNTAALQRLCVKDGRLHAFARGDRESQVVDQLWGGDQAAADAAALNPLRAGLTAELWAAYDAFVDACLDNFDPSRIVLVRSHVARFYVTEDGELEPTNGNDRVACFLDELDRYFIRRTGCLVSDAALGQVPSKAVWHAVDSALRVRIEDDVVRLVGAASGDAGAGPVRPAGALMTAVVPPAQRRTAAGHVIRSVKQGRPVDARWLQVYFSDESATHDDLLALAYLKRQRPGRHDRLVQTCVRRAVRDPRSYPVSATRHRVDRSVQALRAHPWNLVGLPRVKSWRREVVVGSEGLVLRFSRGGSVSRIATPPVAESDAAAVVDGRLPLTPHGLAAVLRSWPVYLERGRRGVRSALRVSVAGRRALLDTCSWVDWAWVLTNETVVVTGPGAPGPGPDQEPMARTDLSFVFDPRTRIGTVGGGLMDQVTHIALFDELCRPHGLELYLDDFRYTWWRSHNGFEASRLAPDLEARRMSRLVSPALLERFRTEVLKTRLPWVFSQSHAWCELGLREAFVVTRDYSNARKLVERDPDFPFLVYDDDEDLGRHMEHPPRPVTFFTTQHRIAIAPTSAGPLARVFSYQHLAEAGLPDEVGATAAVLRARPHVAFHVRRGDYLAAHFDTSGWHAAHDHYVAAIRFLVDSELGTSEFDIAVFSDDLDFVERNAASYGLDLVGGQVRFVGGNDHFDSIYDSYLMSLCPVIVGSVGFFAATTSLLADPPSVFVRAQPGGVRVAWRREA